MRRPIFLKVNHQLESRMPEIGLFGSEGGAPTHGVPTLSVSKASRLTEKSVPVYLAKRPTQSDHATVSESIGICPFELETVAT